MNRSVASNRSMNRSISQQQQVKPITLQGSATIVSQFFRYAVNSILYQRGVYSPETFDRKEEYGITLFVTKDKEIQTYFDNIIPSLEGWLSRNELKSLSMVIISSLTGEILEKWDFDVINVTEQQTADTTISGRKISSRKDLSEIQKGIRNVMRQITATVTFLPLLDTRCSFDLKVYLKKKAEVNGKEWREEDAKEIKIKNGEVVELRSFSTNMHRVRGRVVYKGEVDEEEEEETDVTKDSVDVDTVNAN